MKGFKFKVKERFHTVKKCLILLTHKVTANGNQQTLKALPQTRMTQWRGYFHILCSTLYKVTERPCSYHLHLKNVMVSFTVHVCFMLRMIYHTDISQWDAFLSVSVQMAKHFLVCESSAWIMTPWAECLFSVPQQNANLKKAKWGTACFSPRVFEGWQAATIHTCWEWRTDQESNMCCGWKIYLEGACVLNWIRKLRERKHKQTGIYISLKLWTGMHSAAPCRDLLF